MDTTIQIKNQHLLWRTGFGPTNNMEILNSINTMDLWKQILNASTKNPDNIVVVKSKEYDDGMMEMQQNRKEMNKEDRKIFKQLSELEIKKLNTAWVNLMVNSEAQLLEKMSFFWHGHFACRVENSFWQQSLLQIIRTNALGNFKTLLKEVSKSSSMISFLNNQQNKKQHPNENFAREVMELFTLGRGNYTETDVKEAARAFTGWGIDNAGQFEFKDRQHDNGVKTVLGTTAVLDGDGVLDILLNQKQTAKFITKKIYKFFVNDNVDDANVDWLSNRFYKNNYDIKKLLTDIFTSEWFYDEKNIGQKIKSPVELLVGIRRFLPIQMEDEQAQIIFQRALGQLLFYPPNVAGWPGGKSWIDSSSLMLRLRIPQLITANEALDIIPKPDDDTMMGMVQKGVTKLKDAARGVSGTIDWSPVYKLFEKTSRENLLTQICTTLLQTKFNSNVLTSFLNNENRENYIKSVVVHVMSTPEYQLS